MFNGGDPVRGYYLDQREFGLTAWREVNVKPTKERKFKVSVSPGCCSDVLVAWRRESFGPY